MENSYFYKLSPTMDNIISDIKSLYLDNVDNQQVFPNYSDRGSVKANIENSTFIQEHYPNICNFQKKYNMSYGINYFRGVDFFTETGSLNPPHRHNTKFDWCILFPVENLVSTVSTCFYESKPGTDNDSFFKTYYESTNGQFAKESTSQTTEQPTIEYKPMSSLTYHSKFYLDEHSAYLFNGNQYHNPQTEDLSVPVKDRLVAYWYSHNKDKTVFESLL